jgi:hypothetical protein
MSAIKTASLAAAFGLVMLSTKKPPAGDVRLTDWMRLKLTGDRDLQLGGKLHNLNQMPTGAPVQVPRGAPIELEQEEQPSSRPAVGVRR